MKNFILYIEYLWIFFKLGTFVFNELQNKLQITLIVKIPRLGLSIGFLFFFKIHSNYLCDLFNFFNWYFLCFRITYSFFHSYLFWNILKNYYLFSELACYAYIIL